MNLLPRWMRPEALRRRGPSPEPDPGDMGTAFGLEFSLGAPASGDLASQPAASPPPRRLRWWLTPHKAR